MDLLKETPEIILAKVFHFNFLNMQCPILKVIFGVSLSIIIKTVNAQNQVLSSNAEFQKSLLAIEQFQYDDAILSLNNCIQGAQQKKDEELLSVALEKRAFCYMRKVWTDSVKADYFRILGLPSIQQHQKEVSRVLILIASACLEKNQPDSSILYADSALKMASEQSNIGLMAKSNQVLGQAYFAKTFLEKTNTCWLEAQRLAESANIPLIKAEVLSLRGILNSDLKNQQEALKLQSAAYSQLIANKQMIEAGTSLMGMGVCYKRLKKYDSAVYYYKRALQLGDSIHEPKIIGKAYHNLADVFTYQAKFDSAMMYSNKSIELFKRLNIKSWILISQNSMGQLYRMMGDEQLGKSNYEKAIPYFEEDLQLARSIGYREYIAKCYEELSYCYDGLGDHKKAYQYYNDYFLLNDSIRNEKNTARIHDLQAMYEAGKKENEILVLNAEKKNAVEKIYKQQLLNYSLATFALLSILGGYFIYKNVQKKRSAEKKLAAMEKQHAIDIVRSHIASDVHDDMGANLTRLGLNAQQLIQTATTEKQKQLAGKIFLESRDVIINMKEIIWASNPANDNLNSLLSFMRQYIDRFFDGTDMRPEVHFPSNIEAINLHPEVKRNLFLILKEALNNAIKYAGSEKVEIHFKNDDRQFHFDIIDFGKGFLENDTRGNGLDNMQKRSRQIAASITLNTSPGNGVHISIKGSLY